MQILSSATRESGTDEDILTRVVVMHAEDLKGISEAFQKMSSCTLVQAIGKETSGDYRIFLLALLGI
jgi:annexin D